MLLRGLMAKYMLLNLRCDIYIQMRDSLSKMQLTLITSTGIKKHTMSK